MADFNVRSEDLREAAHGLRGVTDMVDPNSAAMAVSQGALQSGEVYAALYAANLKQTKAARKAGEETDALAQLLMDAADALDELDQDLAEGFEG